MYSPDYNRVEDRPELLAFLRANNFPALVTGTGGVLHASHLPATITAPVAPAPDVAEISASATGLRPPPAEEN